MPEGDAGERELGSRDQGSRDHGAHGHGSRDHGARDTGSRSGLDRRRPARHELPAVDEAGLYAGRQADRLVAAAEASGATRWLRYFEAMPDRLRDDEPRSLRQVALRARAAYGPKDSVRDVLPPEVTEPFLEAIDRLLKQLNKRDAGAA